LVSLIPGVEDILTPAEMIDHTSYVTAEQMKHQNGEISKQLCDVSEEQDISLKLGN